MPTKININSQNVLLSGLKANQQLANYLQVNLLNKDKPGYVATDSSIQGKITSGGLTGVTTSALKQRVNENLISEIRMQNSVVCSIESMDSYYQKIMEFFGEKGAQNSFAHIGGEMSSALSTYKKDPTGINAPQAALSGLRNHASSITKLATNIKDLGSTLEIDIQSAVNATNSAITKTRDLSQDLKIQEPNSAKAFECENQRRESLQLLSEQLGIRIVPYNLTQLAIYDNNDNILMQGEEPSELSYDPKSPTPLTLTTVDGRIINLSKSIYNDASANESPKGRLAGLMKLHESVIPGLQKQLDEYTKVMRDRFNEVHNLGISMNPPSTLTGTIGVPGNSVIDGSTMISGTGIVRIGAVDPKTGILSGSIDITLSDDMSIQSIVDTINNASDPSFITASITADGRLQLESDANSGVVIGSVGNQVASLNSGSTYNPNMSTNFSHFFGLNNLFVTGDQNLGGSATGISLSLSVRDDIKDALGSNISIATLSKAPIAPTTSVLLPGDVTVLSVLADMYTTSKELFASTGISGATTATLSSYADSMVKLQKDNTVRNTENLMSETSIYERLSKQASDISKVDDMQTLQDMLNIQTSISFLIKAISMANKMQQDLLQIVV